MEWGNVRREHGRRASVGSAARTGGGEDTAVATGVPEAGDFAAVLPGHVPAMLRVATALVGPADAEDAAQEAITRAWQAWSSLRDVGAARSWLLRITVNVCRNWQRGRFGTTRRLTEPLDESDASETLVMLDADPGTSDYSAALDLRQLVNTLDDDLRLIVVLRFYAGMDATEIGASLSIPSATVRTRLRRALRLLRERLAQPSDTPYLDDPKGGRQ